eukprot:jgi/Tetstr1/421722/TSEL_001181.t1
MASTSYQQPQLVHRAHFAHIVEIADTMGFELLEQLCQDAAALDTRQQADDKQQLDDFLLLEQRACSETAAAEAVGADLALLLAPGFGASASCQRETEAFLLRVGEDIRQEVAVDAATDAALARVVAMSELWLLDFELSACSSKQLGDEPSTPPRAMAAEDKAAVGAFETPRSLLEELLVV